ncbi:hypothetical protein M407DRAFT_17220 [Tulasnella calospora MUT 4182]|uniref:Uncharacterized protein n=1 Tax=Tulasnella calospora MUT 4182 TaxID=1051891 RepID=A0A0C3QW44_9AGAM|nr:hypothetical protein M407DRAFT_17220 [Tulasnella calospora MUT 4182]
MSSSNDDTAASAPISFVTPVGGFPTKADLIASIVFASVYGLAVAAFLWRLINSRTRVILPVLCTFLVSVEQIVVFSLRANAGAHPSSNLERDDFFLFYEQASFGISFALLGIDLTSLLRVSLVNTTLADERRGSFDQAERRKQYRRLSRLYRLLFAGVAVLGALAGVLHGAGVTPMVIIVARYANAVFGALLLGALVIHLQRLRGRVMYLPGSSADLLTVFAGLLLVVPLYRITIIHNRTPLLPPNNVPDITNQNALSSTLGKMCFYIFQITPEFIVAATLSVLDIRRAFNTGIHGDWRWSDKDGIPRLRLGGAHIKGVGVDPKRHSKRMSLEDDDERTLYTGLLMPAHVHMQQWFAGQP